MDEQQERWDIDACHMQCESIAQNTEALFTQMDQEGSSMVFVYLQNIEAHLILLDRKLDEFTALVESVGNDIESVRKRGRVEFLIEHISRLRDKKDRLYRLFEARKRKLLAPTGNSNGMTIEEVERLIRKSREVILEQKKNSETAERLLQELQALKNMVDDGIREELEMQEKLAQIDENVGKARGVLQRSGVQIFMRKCGMWIIVGALVLIDVCVLVIRLVRR